MGAEQIAGGDVTAADFNHSCPLSQYRGAFSGWRDFCRGAWGGKTGGQLRAANHQAAFALPAQQGGVEQRFVGSVVANFKTGQAGAE
ncbi:hypothetical protein D3C78_1447940 [compost metagenome]